MVNIHKLGNKYIVCKSKNLTMNVFKNNTGASEVTKKLNPMNVNKKTSSFFKFTLKILNKIPRKTPA